MGDEDGVHWSIPVLQPVHESAQHLLAVGLPVALAHTVLCHGRHSPAHAGSGPPALGGAGAGRQRPPDGTQHPRICRGSWGNKPLETPSVSGSGDIVSVPITLHPFRALAAAFSALPRQHFPATPLL